MVIPQRYGWIVALICIGLLITAQLWSMRDVERRVVALHSLLSNAQTTALKLTRHIGYGGFIHYPKDLVVPAPKQRFYATAQSKAGAAPLLISDLERNEATLRVKFSLENIRTMVTDYQSTSKAIKQLYEQGGNPASIDPAVIFDDNPVSLEIDALLDQLSLAIDRNVTLIKREAQLLNWVRGGGIGVLGTLVLTLLWGQTRRRQHLNSLQEANRDLQEGNIELTSVNSSLQQLAGMVSHDLRAPLRHIQFYCELVKEECKNPKAVEEHINSITTSVKRLERLLESLLEFTKSGFVQPDPNPHDVKELVDCVFQDLRPSIEAAGAEVMLNLTGTVQADAELLRSVLHNLLSNSLKYAASDRVLRIEIAAKLIGDHIEFSISDNGIGIEPQYAERIFEPCQRLHDDDSEYEGSGIGLSLAKAIIDAHGGKIYLDTDYREGARFIFTLDAAAPNVINRAA